MAFPNKQYEAITRLLAGFLEKLSVASLAVGLFQNNFYGLAVGFVSLIVSAFLVCLLEWEEK